jgi:hypothetical protein
MFSRTEIIFGRLGFSALVADLLFAPGISDVTWAAIDMLMA